MSFKLTAFDDLYPLRLSTGDTILGGSNGSNSAVSGGDVTGTPGDLTVVGLRQRVSLSSNMGDNTVGSVLTTIQSSPWLATFAMPSNTSSLGSNAMTRTQGGQGRVTVEASSGSAKTLMLGGANYFVETLTADCTFTFTGWATSGFLSEIGVRVTENGTGGWTPTFSGVTWIGGTTPTHDTTALSSTEYVFWSADGGTTIIGGQVGAAGSGSAITVEDEGTPLTTALASMDFVGSGVVATTSGDDVTVTISGAPTGAAGGDLSGTYPNPSVVDDSHSHTSATVPTATGIGPILITDTPAGSPLIFGDLLQTEEGDDLLYADA